MTDLFIGILAGIAVWNFVTLLIYLITDDEEVAAYTGMFLFSFLISLVNGLVYIYGKVKALFYCKYKVTNPKDYHNTFYAKPSLIKAIENTTDYNFMVVEKNITIPLHSGWISKNRILTSRNWKECLKHGE